MATTHDQLATGRRRQQGLTLLEVAIVVAVAAIVAATAAPSFSALLDSRRLDSAATRLAADIQLARSEAIARNRSLRLSVFAGAGASCWIVHSGAAADCSCSDAGAVCGGDARAIKSVALPSRERVSVAANVASIVFDPLHGTSTPTGTLRLVGARGAVHHVVNVVGRVRSCSPEGVVAGYSPC
ncbi:MAG TPA: GspH/FimT family pseudopilin [Caldimonas sp.]|jgi:type IV fimbrial biogenesis protein FimT|nr:GspH/FimT family pseudopilin [Caldimonas sp.]HEV7578340.1 GspH/FimT family pseudopilin [Caldimonas sp.]